MIFFNSPLFFSLSFFIHAIGLESGAAVYLSLLVPYQFAFSQPSLHSSFKSVSINSVSDHLAWLELCESPLKSSTSPLERDSPRVSVFSFLLVLKRSDYTLRRAVVSFLFFSALKRRFFLFSWASIYPIRNYSQVKIKSDCGFLISLQIISHNTTSYFFVSNFYNGF